MKAERRSRRSNFEIATNIIEASIESARLTDIVYNARLNFSIAHKYLNYLTKVGLLRRYQNSNTFRATEKGLEFIKAFRRVQELYGLKEMR